ncbi:MAG: ribonuclease D [Candidatus Tokpelaia sp. JSC189]|nr:MAG: ribonuclease D [Candidatus Tokpelaia sp. JSC189]
MNLITDTDSLKNAINLLSQSDFVTVDTEFHRETTFWPELCLIQIASLETTALIDPLARNMDLRPFFELMANKQILKIFHAARQDIEIIFQIGQLIPQPLFDTQIAAMVCGYGDSISYDILVSKITGHHIDKSTRFTDWSKRPLTEKQLRYALADVTYLRDVYLSLHNKLQKAGRSSWMNEETSVLTAEETYILLPEVAWKRVKGRVRKPREYVILQKIAAWREQEARQRNLPRRRILKDETLIEIAIQQPKDRASLANLRTLPKGYERSSSVDKLLKSVEEGLSIPQESLPKLEVHIPQNETNKSEVDILKLLLKLVTEENNVAGKIVATADDITKIVLQKEKADIPAMHGWRFDMFGKKALNMLKGRIGIKFDHGKIRLFEIRD